MVFPLYDHSPFKWPTPPYVTWALIAVNVAVFGLLQTAVGESRIIHHAAGLIPAAYTPLGVSGITLVPPLTLVTYMFLHANFWHLFGNMIFLWVFGDDIEEALGHGRFLAFYLACGIGAAIAFILSDPSSKVPLVGASGAIAGVTAAYVMFRPCAKVLVLLFGVPVRLGSMWVIGGWAIWQFVEVASKVHNGVAYWAHVGGLTTGAILFLLIRPPGVPLFECMQPETVAAGGRLGDGV